MNELCFNTFGYFSAKYKEVKFTLNLQLDKLQKDTNSHEHDGSFTDSLAIFYKIKWVVAALVLILILLISFSRFTEYLAGELVKNQIKEQTNNQYALDYKRLKIKWLDRAVLLKKPNYHKSIHFDTSLNNNDYSFKVNEIYVELESISEIYFSKTLHIDLVRISNPELDIHKNKMSESNSSFSLESGQLYELLQGFVSAFQIDELDVAHMHLDYFSNGDKIPFTVNDLSFNIKNFLLDSASVATNNQFFFTESFEMKVKDQKILFKDHIHYTHFDSLILSTTSNNIEIYNVKTDTLPLARQSLKENSVNRYFTHLPYVGIKGLDFNRAYQENILHVDSIIYKNPILDASLLPFVRKPNETPSDSVGSNSLISQLLSLFNKYELDQFQLLDAKLSAQYNSVDSANIDGLSIEFINFVLDSSDLYEEVFYPNFEHLSLTVDRPKFKLPNKSILTASNLTFSTQSEILEIKDVTLQNKGFSSDKMNIQGQINSIYFLGVNPEEIVTKHFVRLDSILLDSPDLLIKPGKTKSAFDMSQFLTSEVRSYSSRSVIISNGSFKLEKAKGNKNNYGVERIDLQLNGFELSKESVKENKVLLSENFTVDLARLNLYLAEFQHEIGVEGLFVNSRSKKIKVTGLNLHPIIQDSLSLKMLADVRVNRLKLSGLDLNNIQNMSKIGVDELQLNDVEATIQLLKSDTSKSFDIVTLLQSLDQIYLKNIDVQNVNVAVRNEMSTVIKFSKGYLLANEIGAIPEHLEVENLKFKTKNLQYGVSKLVLPFSEMKHILNVDSVQRTIDSTLIVRGLSFRPIPGVSIPDSSFSGVISIPELSFTNFHSFENRYTSQLSLGYLHVKNPTIKIKLAKSKGSGSKFELVSHLTKKILNDEISAISLEGMQIEKGIVSISNDSVSIAVGDLDMDSKNWFISDSTEWQRDKFLWAEDFSFRMKALNFNVPSIDFCHLIDSLTYSFSPNKFTVHGLYLNTQSAKNTSVSSKLSLYLPSVDIINPDLYAYLVDSSLVVDRIVTRNGMFEGYFNNSVKDKSADKAGNPFNIPTQIPNKLGNLRSVAIHEIAVKNTNTELRIHYEENVAPLDLSSLNVQVDSFHIVPGERLDSNRLLWANNIELNIENIYTTLDNGLYELGADQFHVSTLNDTIGLTNISFIPSVWRYDYALYKGHQTDVFTVYANDLAVSKFNFSKALYENKIQGDYVEINKPSLNILKDKRIPAAPYKFKKTIPELFKKLPITVSMDSLLVNDMRIRYEEFPENGRNSGVIKLTHMNIVAKNATNDSIELRKDSTFTIEMNAMLLDTAYLTFEANYDFLSENNDFVIITTVGEFDATLLNSFVEPVYLATINSAQVTSMDMKAIGNDSVAGGEMGLYYSDLKFSFVDEISMEKEGFANKLKSAIGNSITKKNNRYHPFKRRSPVFFVRDTNKGWIGYLIKIELSGVASSVNLKNYKKDLKKTNKALWKDFDKMEKKTLKEKAKQEKKENKRK